MKCLVAVLPCLIGLALVACGPDPAGGSGPRPPDARPSAATGSSAPASTAPAICGEDADAPLPTPAAVAALGRPFEQARFTLAEPVTEFRIKLLNHFRPPRDAAVAVWERTWSSGDCRLTIWSVRRGDEWRPVERLHWSAGDVF